MVVVEREVVVVVGSLSMAEERALLESSMLDSEASPASPAVLVA
jgi:hypothetical protein